MSLGETLASAATLLHGLPRRREGLGEARAAVAAWAARNAAHAPQLVVDERPDSPLVGYDLLLDHPGGGTLALTVEPEDGLPWAVAYSSHWASCLALTVNGQDLSLRQALRALRTYTGRAATVTDALVEHCLLLEAAAGEQITQAEAQEAADAIRRSRGLLTAAQFTAWLAATGLSTYDFQQEAEQAARVLRFRRRKEAELAPVHLAVHRHDFDEVEAVWVTSTLPLPPEALPEAPAPARPAGELPEPLRAAVTGLAVGPLPYGEGYLTGLVRSRLPADPEQALPAAGRAAFRQWLAGRRTTARVRWH
ncbi:hypothetical protein ACIBG7_03670 [Nonomuraea sp. NPDC050328]|uniref:hypothetical protein n=1 Tax=Nonomuraea sp. NPDC050328 TaxID=3364361 RepID=UPI00378DC73A